MTARDPYAATQLVLYCDLVDRTGYSWRERVGKHCLKFWLGEDEVPDQDVPCPVKSCRGTVVVRSRVESVVPKKKRSRRKKKA